MFRSEVSHIILNCLLVLFYIGVGILNFFLGFIVIASMAFITAFVMSLAVLDRIVCHLNQ